MSMHIPDRYRPGLVALAALPDDAANELCALLDKDLNILRSRENAFEAAANLKKLKQEEAFKIIEALIPLVFLHASSRKNTDELVRDLTRALSVGEEDGKRLSNRLETKFSEHLTRVLNLPAVGLRGKALALSVEVSRSFSDAKIYSDIRAVFAYEKLGQPQAAIVIHNLKLQHTESGNERDVYISMSNKELLELKDVIDRAIRKEELLLEILKKSGLTYIETSD